MRSKSRAKSIRLGRWLNPYSSGEHNGPAFQTRFSLCAGGRLALLGSARKPRFSRYLVVPLALTIGFLALLPSSYRFFLSVRIFLQTPLRGDILPPSISIVSDTRPTWCGAVRRSVSKYGPRKKGSLRRASSFSNALGKISFSLIRATARTPGEIEHS